MLGRLIRAAAVLRPRAVAQMARQLQHLGVKAEELRKDADDLRRRAKRDAAEARDRHEQFQRHTTAQLERITGSIRAGHPRTRSVSVSGGR